MDEAEVGDDVAASHESRDGAAETSDHVVFIWPSIIHGLRAVASPCNRFYLCATTPHLQCLGFAAIMVLQITVSAPQDLDQALSNLTSTDEADKQLSLEVYAPLTGQVSPQDEDHRNASSFGVRLLEPLYDDWCHAIRALQPLRSSPNMTVVLDLTRAASREPNATNLVPHEARGLTRITALLRQRLGSKPAVVVGAPCWCVLRECEKHVVLPKGQSWPLNRSSHVPLEQSGIISGRETRCMTLATEHWDDEHWNFVEVPV